MTPASTKAWTSSDPYARSLSAPEIPLILHTDTGERLILDAERFTAPPDAIDLSILDRCHGPTLDLGCGPGRLVTELAARGIPALGVDVAAAAVLLGRAAGAAVLNRSVFDRLPGTGRWPHTLLMDGNIGIGGDPTALLDRLRTLLCPETGELIIETEHEDVHHTYRVRFADTAEAVADPSTPTFGWARVGTEALLALAEPLGYLTRESWRVGTRRFVALTHPGASRSCSG